jgi:hypothetical protein
MTVAESAVTFECLQEPTHVTHRFCMRLSNIDKRFALEADLASVLERLIVR